MSVVVMEEEPGECGSVTSRASSCHHFAHV